MGKRPPWIAGVLVLVAVAVAAKRERPAPPPAAPRLVATPAPADAKRVADLAERAAPPAEQRAALKRYLKGRQVSDPTAATLLRHTRDGIALRPSDGKRSGLGGRAWLPPGTKWPTTPKGSPLTFIAALDFAELPHLDPLPPVGVLALYANLTDFDPASIFAAKAYYFAPGSPVERRRPPRSTHPGGFMSWKGTVQPIAGDPFVVNAELEGAPDRERLLTAMNDLAALRLYPSHVLGAPVEFQSAVADVLPGKDWTLLAQIESEGDLMIADGGALYFALPRADLAALRFGRVMAYLESH